MLAVQEKPVVGNGARHRSNCSSLSRTGAHEVSADMPRFNGAGSKPCPVRELKLGDCKAYAKSTDVPVLAKDSSMGRAIAS